MKIAIVFGASGEKAIPRLKTVKDNLTIDNYSGIPSFIDTAIKRDLVYDRVVLLSTMLSSDSELEDLHTYWSTYSKTSTVVVICRKQTDDVVAARFMTKFVSTQASAMLVDRTSLKTFADSILLTPQEINKSFGLDNYMDIEEDEGASWGSQSTEVNTQQVEEQVVSNQQQDITVQQDVVGSQQSAVNQKPKKQKSGLLGGIFGRKKDVTDEVVGAEDPVHTHIEANTTYGAMGDIGGIVGDIRSVGDGISDGRDNTVSEDEAVSGGFDTMPAVSEFEPDMPYEDYAPKVDEFEPDIPSEFVSDAPSGVEEESAVVTEEPVTSDMSESIDNGADSIEPDMPIVDEFTSDVVADSPQNGIAASRGSSVQEVGELDIEGIEIPAPVQTPERPKFNFESKKVSVDVEFGSEDFSAAESQYRTQTEQPKIIEREVVREVVRGTSSVLKNILKGATNRTLVFTGDRGTGVTLTAYSVAKKFAERVPVLYVDLDTERHGLLSYIDYDVYRSYGELAMQDGINKLRSADLLPSCICTYNDNLDIVTSDYTKDTSDEAIEIAQGVVAECQNDYPVVVVDCPVDKLHLIPDLILTGNVSICVENSKRGIMNFLCSMENSQLAQRHKRAIVSKGCLLFTKLSSKVKPEDVLQYGSSLFESDGVNWLGMRWLAFDGKLSKDILTAMLES